MQSGRFVWAQGFGGSSPGLDPAALRAGFKGGTQVTQTLAQEIVLQTLGLEEMSPRWAASGFLLTEHHTRSSLYHSQG